MVNLISLHPNKENVLILPFVGHFKIDKIIQYTQFIYIILVQPFCTLAGKKSRRQNLAEGVECADGVVMGERQVRRI